MGKLVAYVINHQPEQWDNFNKVFSKVRYLDFKKVPAVKHDDIHISYGLNHKRLVEQAKKNELDMIIIVEDSSLINNDVFHFDQMFGRLMTWLKNNRDSWDIFVGSSIGINGKQERLHNMKVCSLSLNNNIVRLPCFSLISFTIYNSSSYDRVVSWSEKSKRYDYFLCNPDKKTKIVSSFPYIVFNNEPSIREKCDISKEYTVSKEFIETRLRISSSDMMASVKNNSDQEDDKKSAFESTGESTTKEAFSHNLDHASYVVEGSETLMTIYDEASEEEGKRLIEDIKNRKVKFVKEKFKF